MKFNEVKKWGWKSIALTFLRHEHLLKIDNSGFDFGKDQDKFQIIYLSEWGLRNVCCLKENPSEERIFFVPKFEGFFFNLFVNFFNKSAFYFRLRKKLIFLRSYKKVKKNLQSWLVKIEFLHLQFDDFMFSSKQK